MYFFVPENLSSHFDPTQFDDILCVFYSITPLQPRPNVCYSIFLIKYPVRSTFPQYLFCYVPVIVSCLSDLGPTYVILCSWASIPRLSSQETICSLIACECNVQMDWLLLILPPTKIWLPAPKILFRNYPVVIEACRKRFHSTSGPSEYACVGVGCLATDLS